MVRCESMTPATAFKTDRPAACPAWPPETSKPGETGTSTLTAMMWTQIHDPGQAWNALTIGATTEKVQFSDATFPDWTPLARPGGLSPSSTTSVNWDDNWPNKPDLVLEGGNAIREPGTTETDTDDSLLLLTTYWRPTERPLTTMGDTSAATAQAARMAAMLMARYPDLWPETIRGLLVHSAEWTPEMKRATARNTPSRQKRLLLRCYGYGVPSLERASWSAANSLTLIAQGSLVPFEKRDGRVGTKDMDLHALPWPREELSSLGSEEVELRLTLSYFIEPNPARRGWKYRHRYPSHGLRFKIKTPTEKLNDFRARVSRDAQSEERPGKTPERPWGGPSAPHIGTEVPSTRTRWTGTAADLAERGLPGDLSGERMVERATSPGPAARTLFLDRHHQDARNEMWISTRRWRLRSGSPYLFSRCTGLPAGIRRRRNPSSRPGFSPTDTAPGTPGSAPSSRRPRCRS